MPRRNHPLRATVFPLLVALACAAEALAGSKKPDPDPEDFSQLVQPFVRKHCAECHSGEYAEAGVDLEACKSLEQVRKDRPTWERVLRMVRGGQMPPSDSPRPPKDDTAAVVAWIEKALAPDCSGPIDPGRVTIRRLNRVEYENTIRDLLGVEFRATDDFPADDRGYGFDTIGDVLSIPPLLMERYLDAAERIADEAVVADPTGRQPEDLPESHRRIVFVRPSDKATPNQAARQVLSRLARRAFRRPVAPEEIDRLVALVEKVRAGGESFEGAIQVGLTAILVSPHFLFKVEKDPSPDAAGNVRALDEHELAVRLSYFLWSTMPDERLFNKAEEGALRKDLQAEVRRMLADAKSEALVQNFAGQWLEIRDLDRARPDRRMFRGFDEKLREAMRTETEMCFTAIQREDRSVLELIDADYTFVNERLARHYGIPDVQGEEFRRVSVQGTPRGGLLTQASILTLTSNPTRTSPVKRGKWVLENILAEPPPPPPPNVPELPEDRKASESASLRQRLEEHRSNPACAVCHEKMDALGFALENFDAVGAWRTRDGRFPIDPAGALPDGREFADAAELKSLLARTSRDQFARCMAENMLTYALGRGLEYYDQCALDEIVGAMQKHDYRFSALVLAIVRSDPFQKRRGLEDET